MILLTLAVKQFFVTFVTFLHQPPLLPGVPLPRSPAEKKHGRAGAYTTQRGPGSRDYR